MNGTNIRQIGTELIKSAQEGAENSLPLSTQLFPYILVASRKMSYRMISSWLKEKHGVSLSAAAISRALANPRLHLLRLAQSFIPRARYVGVVYGGRSAYDLLYSEVCDGGPNELDILAHDMKNPGDEDEIPAWQELQSLAEDWGAIPHEVQLMIRQFVEHENEDDEDIATIRYEVDDREGDEI